MLSHRSLAAAMAALGKGAPRAGLTPDPPVQRPSPVLEAATVSLSPTIRRPRLGSRQAQYREQHRQHFHFHWMVWEEWHCKVPLYPDRA
jgi:hypothetical protein